MKSDLVDHSHRNLQDVRNMDCGCSRRLKCQTKVMNHHLDVPWLDWRNLGAHNIQHSELEQTLQILLENNHTLSSDLEDGLLELYFGPPGTTHLLSLLSWC